eukprot:scaffold658811_cov43-Prasinocladus_malaysianus.AAC.1
MKYWYPGIFVVKKTCLIFVTSDNFRLLRNDSIEIINEATQWKETAFLKKGQNFGIGFYSVPLDSRGASEAPTPPELAALAHNQPRPLRLSKGPHTHA